MGKSVPDAPDYTAAAQATADSSKLNTNAQTSANRPNQNTPFGSTSWSKDSSFDDAGYQRAMSDWQAQGQRLGKNQNDPDYLALMPRQNDYYSNEWTQNTTLDPDSQHALDSQLKLQSGRSDLANSLFPRAQDEFGQAMDWSGFNELKNGPNVPTYQGENIQRGIGDTGRYLSDAEDAIYNKWNSRATEANTRNDDQLRTQLYNAGLKEGDKAYEEEFKKLRQSQGDAREQAAYQATIGAGQEAQRYQGMDIAAGGFANSAAQQALQQQLGIGGQQFAQGTQAANTNNTLRQQQIAETLQKRGFSLNEINAIISGQQVGMPSMPGFNTAGKSETVDYSGAAKSQYDARLDAANAQNAAIGNVANLAGGAMAFSDRRLKREIRKVGEVNGIPVYDFKYLWDDQVYRGVMADEVAHIPGAVHRHSSGYDMVDYGVING